MSLLQVDDVLMEQVFAHLGLDGTRVADSAALEALYLAWCRTVPFDSLQKRVFFAGPATGPVPGSTAARFLRDLLASGTGGTCWSTSMGLLAVARHAGFDASLVVATMHTDPDTRPNHCSVLVRLGAQLLLMDTSMLFERPVALANRPIEYDPAGLHAVCVQPLADGIWTIWWKPGHHRDSWIGCDLDISPVTDDEIEAYHDRTRGYSLFNSQLFIRKNYPGRIETYGRGKLIVVDSSAKMTITPIAPDQVSRLLTLRFNIERTFAEAIPDDEPDSEGWV